MNITRSAFLAARFPGSVPSTTVDRQCGSSQRATAFAAQGVIAGFHDVVIPDPCSGCKVRPREVEHVLYEHPAVHDASVVGQLHEYRGETFVAFLSLKSGTSATEQDLVAFTKDRLAAYKYRRAVHIIGDLPKPQAGKDPPPRPSDDDSEARPSPVSKGNS